MFGVWSIGWAGTVDHLRVFSRDVSEEPRQAMDVNEVVESSLKLMQTQLENHGIDLALIFLTRSQRSGGIRIHSSRWFSICCQMPGIQ